MKDRAHERRRTILRAQIVLANGASTVDCVVRNLSDGGALVEVDGAIALPNVFELRIIKTGDIRCVIVRWRSSGQMGVQFAGSPVNNNVNEFDAERQVRVLEARIAEMRRRAEAHGVAHIFEDQHA